MPSRDFVTRHGVVRALRLIEYWLIGGSAMCQAPAEEQGRQLAPISCSETSALLSCFSAIITYSHWVYLEGKPL